MKETIPMAAKSCRHIFIHVATGLQASSEAAMLESKAERDNSKLQE